MSEIDKTLMARAIGLARLGDPSPNPPVGALVASGDQVLSDGFHQSAGEEHAEVIALNRAGSLARGKTLVVTLEPCNHHGRTPPCVDAILASGVRRVVIGVRDPNPHVPGGGAARLREAGVEVIEGVLEDEAHELIKPWSKFITLGTSYLTLKLGLSLDGRITTRSGASKWITCSESRLRVQSLRTRHDAVMIGIKTALADDPRLTVRDVPGRSPARVIVDSKLRLPISSVVVQTAREVPTCVLTTPQASLAAEEALEALGVRVIRVSATAEGRCDAMEGLRELAAREVVSVMCEGGAELAGSLLAHRAVDELHVFMAPRLLGPRGRPGAVDWAGPENPEQAPRIDPAHWELSGTDAYVWGPMVYAQKTARTNPGS